MVLNANWRNESGNGGYFCLEKRPNYNYIVTQRNRAVIKIIKILVMLYYWRCLHFLEEGSRASRRFFATLQWRTLRIYFKNVRND